MKHTYRKLLAWLLIAVLCLTGCKKVGGKEEISSDIGMPTVHSRDYYTDIKGSGEDSWLIMVYMNAADAEEAGLASYALSQLLSTQLSTNITVSVQTYGTDAWQGEFMSKLSDRIRIRSAAVQTASYGGAAAPGTAAHLGDFVEDAIADDDADRKALIFWGEHTLSAQEIAAVLEDARLDFIAFDTQPITAFEDLYLMRDVADYLIASAGQYAVSWDFEHLLTNLGHNTSFMTKDIARLLTEGVLADDVFATTGTTPALYCADLTRMEYLYECLHAFLDEIQVSIEEGKFAGIALARAAAAIDDTKVSMAAFTDALIYESSAPCKEAHSDALVYTSGAEVSLSLYLPVSAEATPDFTETLASWAARGLDYTEIVPTYLTAATCANGTGSDQKWFLADIAGQYLTHYQDYAYPAEKVALEYTGQNFVLPLDVEDSGKVYRLEVSTFADTGEHYLLLGESLGEMLDLSGDMIAASGTDEWMYVNGQPVYRYGYTGSDGTPHFLVSCTNNDKPITLLITDDEVQTSLVEMGVFTRTEPIVTGDILAFSYPMYAYTGEYLGESSYGYKVAVAEGLTVAYGPVDIGDMLLQCALEDISGHTYLSPVLNMRSAMMEG